MFESTLARSHQRLAIKKDEMYYIPILQSLQTLISNKSILEEVSLLNVTCTFVCFQTTLFLF